MLRSIHICLLIMFFVAPHWDIDITVAENAKLFTLSFEFLEIPVVNIHKAFRYNAACDWPVHFA